MESYLEENFGGVKAKNSSEEALRRWRRLCSVVKNPKRRFRFTANLDKRGEAQAIKHANHVRTHLLFLSHPSSPFLRTGIRLARGGGIWTGAAPPAGAGGSEKLRVAVLVSKAALQFLHGLSLRSEYVVPEEVKAAGFQICADELGAETDCLETSEDAHEEDNIKRRQEIYGLNKFTESEVRSFWVFVWEALQDTTLIILAVCAFVSLVVGIAMEGWPKGAHDGLGIVASILLVVVFVTATSDYRQSLQFKNLDKEKKKIRVQVTRDGFRQWISIYDLLPGDVVHLQIGDQVPADGLFISGFSLLINESSLTGESEPVVVNEDNPFLLSGTKVQDGSCKMLVTTVGMRTQWGKLMATLSEGGDDETPLQVKLNGVATIIGKIGLFFAVITFIVLSQGLFGNKYHDGQLLSWSGDDALELLEHFAIAVTIVVVAVPEGLPLAVTLSLAFAMKKMMNDKALVRNLAACETMGSATTICSDKTGTLTTNHMTVVKACICGKIKEGEILKAKRDEAKIVKVEPFNSSKKRMSVILELPGGGCRAHCKGASEIILAACDKFIDETGNVVPMDKTASEKLNGIIDNFAGEALRTLCLAYREMEEGFPGTEQIPLQGYTCIGIVGIKDPVRPGVRESVAICRSAGIMVRMVTGDNINTAKAIARECGILTEDGVAIEGPEFREKKLEELLELVPKIQVMARSSPLDKHTLVKHLRTTFNDVVAVTGDGTNDAPALHEADIGLAMGIAGTEVAKESADVIILDDNFSTIVTVAKWGRSVYINIQKFVQFQLTVNVVALLVNFSSACFTGNTPLTAVQLLWVNMIMDTLGALALATEPPNDELMKREPTQGKSFFGLDESSDTDIVLNTIIFNSFVFCQVFNEISSREIWRG
ncbi:hypothetical protein PR202_gb24085 [Eleusine coracana subsp. coracana]|uniref:Cation-transporting P-type ATPase N-terminal domain-containing protein n=1 Tax=Eleusine coracana subsp. coracana TaxID=191504 RepID=A0AAV5FKI7_ELECO|nr:hypothetical protein PR202_gb24085 [Eleusine coracana subsp. coracana]